MKRIFIIMVSVAAIAAWCTPSFATTIITGSGPLTSTTDNIIFNNGGSEQTLTVSDGQNIFANNNPALALTPLAVATDNDSLSDIIFNGNSSVYGGIGGAKVFKDITAGTLTGKTVNFLGAVNATKFNVGAGTVNFNSGTSNNGAANFAGAGTTGKISLAPNTTVIGALTTGTDNTGILELGDGSRWQGAVGGPAATAGLHAINIIGGNNDAGVTAYIGTANTGAVNAYTFSLGTNILRIGGALTIADNSGIGGVIDTTLASESVYGHIIPVGAANLGSALTVNVTVPSTAYFPVGTKFNVVDATSGGTNGSDFTVTVKNPTNPLYTFSPDPLYPPGTTAGMVTIITDSIPLQESSNPAVPVLATLPVTPDLNNVLGPLNALAGDSTALDNATAQLAPSTPALAAPLVTFQGIRRFEDLWSSRLDACREESNQPDANCHGSKQRNGWWVKGFEYEGRQNAQEESTGYHSRTIGTMVACDTPIGENTRAGLGFGYARSTINGDKFDASTDLNAYQLIAFIGHERGPWFVNGSASFGLNDYSSMRHIVYPGVDRIARAKYRGQDYTVFMNTGYHFTAKKFTITPIASLQYTRMHLSGYTEKGAGDINLKVKSQNYDFLESGLGVKVERAFSDSHGRKYVPEGHFNWFHEFCNPELEQTAAYTAPGSSSFKTSGLRTADNTFNVGGGISILSCTCNATTWSLEAVYDHDWRNDGYSANQITMRFISRF